MCAALFLLVARCTGTPDYSYADDPMNRPLDSVGVTGYDTTLCSDRWSTCSAYDRSQFDTKYPGTSLDSISLYPLAEKAVDEVSRGHDLRDTDTDPKGSAAEYGRDDSSSDGEE